MTRATSAALAGLAVGTGAIAWPALTTATGFGLPCAVRMVTGIPCPACGLTTASVALVRGHVVEAAAANPMVFVLALVAVAAGVVAVLQARGFLAPRPWPEPRRNVALGLVALVVVVSEGWQLHRFGLV